MKLWGGRFKQNTNKAVENFTASIEFDHKLTDMDILGSVAHISTLEKGNIINSADADKIKRGLIALQNKIKSKQLQFSISDEDIHMNIEKQLHKEIGETAGKLHTGRSRNDQVALDLHLYLRQQVLIIIEKANNLQNAFINQAQQHINTILPGYTHLQRAQPVRLTHHFLVYCSMLQRDIERLIGSWPRINTMPLGAGALAGNGFDTDREYTAKIMEFDYIYENSMDAVSDRDFIVEFLSNAALIMTHLSRLSEEIILWSSSEFSFIQLDDAFCTGSSMMPQKKNPDVAELIRGKTGRVYGALISMLTILKGLPLTYNRDLQEDKEGLFDTINTVINALDIYTPMINTMKINKKNMLDAVVNGYSNATELADYLVRKNVPFRNAHKIVGEIVLDCIEKKILLCDLPIHAYKEYSLLFDVDLYSVLKPENAVELKTVQGGTAKKAVLQQLQSMQSKVVSTQQWLSSKDFRWPVELVKKYVD